MNIVSIIASPRKNGNTEKLVNEINRGIRENHSEITEYFLNDLNLQACQGCRRCEKGLECKIEDDTVEILQTLQKADLVIFGSPIYFSQLSAQAKLLIDRFYSVFINPDKEFNAKLILILTHGFPQGTYDDYLNYAGERTFELAGFNVIDKMVVGGLHNSRDIKEHEEKLKEAYEIGKKL